MNTRTFFDIMGTAPAAVTVVTTTDRLGRPQGLTVAAVCSVSADPPLLLVCIDARSRTLGVIRERGAFGVNFLDGAAEDVAARFASAAPDRFADTEWRAGELGLPILAASLAHAECRIADAYVAGDHVVIFARVEAGAAPAPLTRPLMYFRHRFGSWPGDVTDPRADNRGEATADGVRRTEGPAISVSRERVALMPSRYAGREIGANALAEDG